MNSYIPAWVVYTLAAIFAVLSVVFLKGKAASLFVGHNTARKPVFSQRKLCKAFGACLAVTAALLLITAVIWNNCPDWFVYVFGAVVGGDILAGVIICCLNIIVTEK